MKQALEPENPNPEFYGRGPIDVSHTLLTKALATKFGGDLTKKVLAERKGIIRKPNISFMDESNLQEL